MFCGNFYLEIIISAVKIKRSDKTMVMEFGMIKYVQNLIISYVDGI